MSDTYPDHLDFAVEDGLWDTRPNVDIRTGDDVYFWLAKTGLVMWTRATSSMQPILASSKRARWHDVIDGKYNYRFELDVVSRKPDRAASWQELQGVPRPIPASNGRVEIKDPKQQAFLKSLFGEVVVSSSDRRDVAFPIGAQHEPGLDLRKFAQQVIAVRRGQGAFRDALVDAYEGRCAVTGSQVLAVLEAAHIDRYFGDHTNHVSNGLLLRADIHTLFDLQRIAVDAHGMIHVLPTLRTSEYGELEGQQLRAPKDPSVRPNSDALLRHWESCTWTTSAAPG
ncbi:HNH endonuclease [Antrihabitans spumae]|uniref:HNH endonuclease n=1 Tax=Antrihabitans spumae TaxID=3373370 RepID=A0ABW7K6I8_9NOCA